MQIQFKEPCNKTIDRHVNAGLNSSHVSKASSPGNTNC